jgi:7-carboxy-7-deazaguanine synthase
MLRVAEIFESIQGESTYAGLPCGFVRLAGCRLRCTYCDTAWAREGGQPMTVEAAAERAIAFGHPVVEVTGGEPLEQPETPALVEALLAQVPTVLVETNGSCDISVLPEAAVRIVDFKTPGSGACEANRWENLACLRPTDEVKFVLTSEDDYRWAQTAMERVTAAGVTRVLLSPAPGRLDAGTLAAWMLRDRVAARLQIQLHKHIRCGGRPLP